MARERVLFIEWHRRGHLQNQARGSPRLYYTTIHIHTHKHRHDRHACVFLFIGTCLVTHALSCVHSAFASCERSFEKKKREKENSPTSQSFRTSSAVSVCVTPPLPSTLQLQQALLRNQYDAVLSPEYSTTPRNENRVNENHLGICLSFSQKNRN